MIFCPSNAHNSNDSFPEFKYSFTARLSLCIVRESDPCQQLGKLLCYHYTNDAEKVYDRRDEFQNFQKRIFPYTFSKCHSKKKPKKFCEKRSKFFANQTNLFSLIESCRFWFVTSKGQWEFKKRQEITISWYFVPLTHTIVMTLSLNLNILLPPVWVYASYGNRTHVNSLESCYATTTPTMLKRFTIEEMNFRTFKKGFFLTHFLSVTARKNQKNFFEKLSKFFANQTSLFSFIESCCCFWFVTSQGHWEFKKRQEITISWYFVPLTHTIVMTLSLNLNILLPPVWVYASYGNRTHVNSLEVCYAYTTSTMLKRFTIEEMIFRTFKQGFFLTHFLNVTSRKNQKNSLRSWVNFSLNRPICSHSSKAVVVSGLLLLKVIGNSKNDKNSLFHEYFVPLTHTIVKFNLSLKTNTLLPPVWVYASYGNRTHVNSLEGG